MNVVKPPLTLLIAAPRGFCAGVDRAIRIVELALERYGAPVYVRHEIVHNKFVVDSLKAKGAIFVPELDQVPDGVPVVFSAHGVPKAVPAKASERGLDFLDATCPLVSKVHLEVTRHARDGCELALIGHEGHAEVLGISGHYRSGGGRRLHLVQAPQDVAALAIDDDARIAYAIQTTYSIDEAAPIVAALTERFPAIRAPRFDDICYATQSRQNAVKALARQCDLILVIGSSTSANSRRLQETAQRAGCRAHLLDTAEDLQAGWFDGCTRVGITAGASTPEKLVQQVVDRLTHWRCCTIESDGQPPEAVVFQLPRAFRQRLEEPDLAGTPGRVERALR
jgi:4-hydroxy-3-methylbut-2-enyl diphosphate reductase